MTCLGKAQPLVLHRIRTQGYLKAHVHSAFNKHQELTKSVDYFAQKSQLLFALYNIEGKITEC